MLDPAAFRAPARRRPRRPARPWALIAVLGLLVIAALVASAGSSVSTRSNRNAPVAAGSQPQPHHSSIDLQARAAREAGEVGSVLRYTPFVRAGLPHRREVALTFDDGPSSYTRKIMAILLRMRVHASFFIVGVHLDQFSSVLRDEVDHGFTVGDHTENHAALAHTSPAFQYSQIRTAAAKAQRLGAPRVKLFRPPYGFYDSQTLRILRAQGMLMVLWSVDTGDWRRPGTHAIVRQALAGARAGGIVLMHDGGGDRSQTVAALPAIINGLRKRHYTLVTVPQLVAADPPPRHQRLP
jgi:peptidoglycan-N-acetylglucosamine deacetylase